ncbi:MAG: S8 family serine peptidase [Pirellulales bacterium]|nr:S8 family serine peptidase [Pirellulales bacterium]
MSFQHDQSNRSARSPKSRRAQGVSRRQRKKQLGFETLEDRRVMSAQPLAQPSILDQPGWEVQTFSSATAEGQLAIFLRELERYASQTGASQVDYVTASIPTDPLVDDQWHLINTGQQVGNPDFQDIFGVAGEDINVAPAWQLGYTGEGVVVAVIDSGTQTDHPDLAANIDPLLQFDALVQDGDANPDVAFDPDNAHGTAVAGIIAAVADNGLGGTGVAPGAQIVPIRLIDSGLSDQAFVDAFRYETNQIDITNNSWGPVDFDEDGGILPRTLDKPTVDQFLALRDSVIFGRDGLGVVHVFASGNHGKLNDTSSYNGWVNSRYTIGVTGVDHDGFYNNVDGTVTGYPETGASVFVAAPTGSNTLDIVDDTSPGAIGSGIFSTDTTGETGYNMAPDPMTGEESDRDYLLDTDYTSRFNGTSAAAPMVSGVIALMLEANPNLSWRDVQEILVRSARRNAPFEEPADGFDKSFDRSFANTWITNQVPLFHDPDPWDISINPRDQVLRPTLDPNLTFAPSPTGGFVYEGPLNHYVPAPASLANGAGYTISQGVGTDGEQIGYAHGVVDATLAVLMSEQWTEKTQHLADELTWTTAVQILGGGFVPSAQAVASILIPGGLGGETGFAEFFNEYFEPEDQFLPEEIPGLIDNERSDGPIELKVPDNNTMTVETIEVSLALDNWVEAMDNLRIVLVSPNGTQSDLNYYGRGGNSQPSNTPGKEVPDSGFVSTGPVVDPDQNEDEPFSFTFSTNRNWGERSDNALIIDPLTGEPVVDVGIFGDSIFNSGPAPVGEGDALQQGWQLYFENWGGADLNISEIEVAFHGSPIDASTERVKGFVGVDDDRSGTFNYTRVLADNRFDANPTIRLGEVINAVDTNQEDFAENVTVLAYRDVNANGQVDGGIDILVDQFVTGHDGNYYFDLVPGDYVFALDQNSLGGMIAQNDSATAAGLLDAYKSEWAVTTDFFKVWDRDVNLNVPVDGSGTPSAWLDANGQQTITGMSNINFLLDPGPPVAQQVVFSGIVFADFDGDGIQNDGDTAMPGVSVFADVNRNGQFDAGETLAATDANGFYTLVMPAAATTVMNVGVIAPIGWTPIDPSTGLSTFFVQVGDVVGGVDFAIMPPVFSPGDGSSQPGILLGSVFEDVNEDAVRQAGEQGLAGVTVYIDANNSGELDPTELVTASNAEGTFVFSGVSPGNYNLRIDLGANGELRQTLPGLNNARNVTLAGNGTVTNITFGIYNDAILDFGDLPLGYGLTTLAEDGARHAKGAYYLGTRIDSEFDGVPSPGADSDEFTLDADEDGVVVSPLTAGAQAAGATGTLTAVASRYGGNLQGWIDFNGNTIFEPSEQILTNFALVAGANVIPFDLPDEIAAADVYARFRYGEFGLGLTGFGAIGEVEDYQITIFPGAIPAVNQHGSDFDEDNDVDGFDFLMWARGFGTASDADAGDGDANSDGQVDWIDLANWEVSFGDGLAPAASVPQTGDFNLDGAADGLDFLAWQKGFGTAEVGALSEGDGTQDGNVDGDDLAVWSQLHGVLGADTSKGEQAQLMATSVGSASRLYVPSLPAVEPAVIEVSLPVQAVEVSAPAALPGTSHVDVFATGLPYFSTLARTVERLGLLPAVGLRVENQIQDTISQYPADRAESGVAHRDQALDNLFARRHEILDYLQRERESEQVAIVEEAVALALSEQIDWRVD